VFNHPTNREPRAEKRKRQTNEFDNMTKPHLRSYLDVNKTLLEPIPNWPSKGWTDLCRNFLRDKRNANPELPSPQTAEIHEMGAVPDENVHNAHAIETQTESITTEDTAVQQLLVDENLAAMMNVIGVTDSSSNDIRGQDACAQQSIFIDWEKVRESLADMAHTSDKFFPALTAKGDYHKNFDSYTFFKWMVSVELTYPDFCKELQKRKDNASPTESYVIRVKLRDPKFT